MNVKIKITEANLEKIQAALDAVNGKATEHTYSRAETVISIANRAEVVVLSMLAKKDAKGARFISNSGSTMPNSYRYSRKGTQLVMERTSKGWTLTEVAEITLWKEGGKDYLRLTLAQDKLAVSRFRKNYGVLNSAPWLITSTTAPTENAK